MGQLRRIGFFVLFFVVISSCGRKQVDAYYYPNRNDLSVYEVKYDIGSVEACRDWVYAQAARNNDSDLERGDYECGIGPKKKIGDLTVYDETVR